MSRGHIAVIVFVALVCAVSAGAAGDASEKRINVKIKDADVVGVLTLISQSANVHIAVGEGVSGEIPAQTLNDVTVEDALTRICGAAKLHWEKRGDVYFVTKEPPARGAEAGKGSVVSVTPTVAGKPGVTGARIVLTKGSTVVGTFSPKGKDGLYQLSCSPGTYDIAVSVRGHKTVVRRGVVVKQGSLRTTMVLRKFKAADYKRLGRVVGFVKNAQGEGINDALLWLLKDRKVIGATHSEAASGVYELEWYEPGTYSVACFADGYQPEDVHNVKIAAGQSVRIDFTLKRK